MTTSRRQGSRRNISFRCRFWIIILLSFCCCFVKVNGVLGDEASKATPGGSSASFKVPPSDEHTEKIGAKNVAAKIPLWLIQIHEWRKRVCVAYIEPVVLSVFGFLVREEEKEEGLIDAPATDAAYQHRRLSLLPNYVEDVNSFKETSMSFASLTMLFVILSCTCLIFLSCFFHNQKTSPLFISPRRHRLPNLVPPPLPVDGWLSWIKVCFLLSDEEIVGRVGYDSLIFLRFHRLALRCIVKMSVFSWLVLLPLNFCGGGHANADDFKGYVGSLIFTDFLRFTMANISPSAPQLWVHCFAAYLLTGLVVRELLVEYEAFHKIRHRYLLSKEPHLRTVLVTNIPRHLRSPSKISTYFQHIYPQAVKSVTLCQNLLKLEHLIRKRTTLLTRMEQEILILCRAEKAKLFAQTRIEKVSSSLKQWCCFWGDRQERLAKLYCRLEDLNSQISAEQRRRKRVMAMLDTMESQTSSTEIDTILANPFATSSYRPPTIGAPRNPLGGATDTTNATNTPSKRDEEVLRSRTPPPSTTNPNEGDGVFLDDGLPTVRNAGASKKKTSVGKAKSAIKRYSKLARNVNFFGRPIQTTYKQSDRNIEDHVNEVTDKAFVVMRTYTASTIAIQSMHSSKPGAMQVTTAPEPRDVLWDNIYVSKGATRTRSYIGETLVLLLIGFYVVPIALVSLLVSKTALTSSSARIAQLDQASAFFSSAIAMVQPLCIVGIQQLLPPLFTLIGKIEGLVSFSEVQMRAFSRYFLFQVLNVFLVTTVAGTIFDTVAIILDNPEKAFEMLGNSLPRLSSFFITLVTMKTFLGLGVELVRTMSLVQALIRYILFPNATLRMKRRVVVGLRAIDDPGWFPFHKILAQDMLVVVISVVFAVVAPIVLLPCALFCLFSRIMWTHHHLYVYESVFETGGQFWPKIFRRFVFGLIIAQMTITGQFILKQARHEAYATIALIFMTYFFLRSTRARYDPSSSTLPLDVATVMDISQSQEEEALKQAKERREQLQQQNAAGAVHKELNNDSQPDPIIKPTTTATTASVQGTTTTVDYTDYYSPYEDSVSDILTVSQQHEQDQRKQHCIGPHDPFQRAYIQPALRANPRAKPEQPFPPAQLGRDNAAQLNDDWSGSGATVRLKYMNQQDRRFVNRWWNDQLQSCLGENHRNNVFKVLIGEECGRLRIGRRANILELTNRRSDCGTV